MGEFAEYGGQRIKIGTCEDMYYLRADQILKISPLDGNVNPRQDYCRFRFPWPDEDHIAPGGFDRHNRGVALWGVEVPAEVNHDSVQFTAPGYNVCLPCPEGPSDHGLKIARNGHPGPVQICQQRRIGDHLVLIARCGGCGAKYNLPTWDDAKPYVDACIKESERAEWKSDIDRAIWWTKIATRIAEGYGVKTA